jgi:hypothetical protein
MRLSLDPFINLALLPILNRNSNIPLLRAQYPILNTVIITVRIPPIGTPMRAHSQEVGITPCVTKAPENAVVDSPVVDWQTLCGELVLDIAFVVSWCVLVVAIVKGKVAS